MRRAADPCLGFYVLPASTSTPVPDADVPPIEVLVSNDSLPDEDNLEPVVSVDTFVPPAPEIELEVLVSDDSYFSDKDHVESVVSVDTFLRRTALPRTKTYSKKRKRRAHDSTDYTPDDMSLETETSLSRSANPIPRRRSKPFTKRLLRAAVLSKTDPEEWLLQEDPIPPRKPLLLVEQRPSREPVQTKRRTWSLVDPKKAVAAPSNSFSRGKAPPGAKRNTLSGWRATYEKISLDGATVTKRKARASVAAQGQFKCLPLTFVSLHEAEKSYSLMRLPLQRYILPSSRSL
ncbi:hypothetical protein K438DRAFT_470974 [Mycena galopus ATCC 62051]|nr:hypothetical protein K438DRAFT_470974 [Mycena galopus ATCC 62051]